MEVVASQMFQEQKVLEQGKVKILKPTHGGFNVTPTNTRVVCMKSKCWMGGIGRYPPHSKIDTAFRSSIL